MKNHISFDQLSQNAGLSNSSIDDSDLVDVQYSQAFGEVAQLLCEYQACLLKIKPLQEEDFLYLLLNRYAQSTGVGVYLKIRRPTEVQIYYSDIPEPHVSLLVTNTTIS
jgi:hypothetical protein